MRFVEYTINTNRYVEDELFELDQKLAKRGRDPSENHTMESLDMIWTALPENSQKIFLTLYTLAKHSDEESVHFLELLEEVK